jgi:hypothetical protein
MANPIRPICGRAGNTNHGLAGALQGRIASAAPAMLLGEKLDRPNNTSWARGKSAIAVVVAPGRMIAPRFHQCERARLPGTR